ncbi:hypothetical protein LFM09_15330 [Lentzea alba]|uniref:hypothetical protein n=1 Tax=Lentzea alba TaxID=2714351 RepID=UPI0039BFFD66
MTDPVQPQPAQTQPQPEFVPQPTFEAHTPEFVPQPEAAVAPAPVAPKPKKTGVVVLAVLVVLLLGAAGTFGALYVQERNRAADLSKQVEEKQKSLTAQTILAQENLESQRKHMAAAEEARKELESAKVCRDAAREVTAAGLSQDQQKILTAVLSMMSKC